MEKESFRVTLKNAENFKEKRVPLVERLTLAAEQTIATQGVAGLKARELAAAAGCALGAIYTAVADLDELILRVNARTLRRLDDALAAALDTDDPGAALIALGRAYLHFARNEEPAWRALFDHRLPQGAHAPEWYVETRNRLFGRLEAPLAQLLPDEDPVARARLARTLFSAVHGVVTFGLDEKLADLSPAQLDAQVDAVLRLIIAGLGGPQRRLP